MKKRLIAFALIICMLSGVTSVTSARSKPREWIADVKEMDLSQGGYVPHSVSVESDVNAIPYTLKGAPNYPMYYNAKDNAIPSGVKNQKSTSLCWAFTHNELLESYIAKTTNVRYDLSEENMKFETSNVSNTQYGFDRFENDGGNEYISTAYLARGGAVLEKDEPFTEGTLRYKNPASISTFGYLKSAPIFEFSKSYDIKVVNLVKELVLNYGAVGSGLYYDKYSVYENPSKTNYYYTGYANNPNHAVTIIGWDDTYSKNNFVNTPEGDGAYIVKNSWGNYHSNGTTDIFYVSYYDKFINYQIFASEFYADNEIFDNIYQYDYFGYVANGGIETTSVVAATVYEAESSNEAVSAVSTYITQSGTRIEVFVSPDAVNVKQGYQKVADQTFEYTGYFNIDFDPIEICGEKFAIAIRYHAPSGQSNTYFPIQMRYAGYVSNPNFNTDTCYFGSDFSNLETIESRESYAKSKATLCMKAFTVELDSDHKHVYSQYVYNGDATFESDGTQSKTCYLCGKKQTITAVGTKLKKIKEGWILSGGKWYYFQDYTAVKNTWKKDNTGWLYLGADGAMLTDNWVFYSGKWYFLDGNGYMVSNAWRKDSTGWCYLGADGAMLTNKWVKDSVGWCYVGANGYCVTNTWKKDSVGWCYLDKDGRMVTNGYVYDSKGKCYLDKNGYWNGIYY